VSEFDGVTSRRDRLGVVLVVLGASQLLLGGWQALAPGSFFDTIGGFGPENPHYLRDVSTFYLALGALLVVSARVVSWRVPALAFAALQYALHTVNHLVDVGDASPSWVGPADAAALAATTASLVIVLLAVRGRSGS
jgi:hypothetical protein